MAAAHIVSLDIDNHRGNLDVVPEPHELGHQRDSRSGGASHRARPSPSGQLAEPTGVEDLDVIVEEHEQLASSGPGAPVVHRRVIERLIPPDHGERKALSLVPPFVRGRALTVVDDDDVERRVVGGTQPGEELLQQRPVVACGDDD